MAVGSSPSPIWQGYKKTLATNNLPVNYSVRVEDTNAVIFTGKAIPNPATFVTEVQLFDILAPYVKQKPIDFVDFWGQEPTMEVAPFARRFVLAYGSQTTNIDMYANWTYDDMISPSGNGYFLTEGVYGSVHPVGFPLVISSRYCTPGTIQLVRGDGTVLSSFNQALTASLNLIFPAHVLPSKGQTMRVRLADGTYSPYIKMVDSCISPWALYYVNAYGGWDVMHLKGIMRRTDNFTREEHDIDYSRNALENASRRIHRIDMGATWELNTGNLTDQQAKRFSDHVPNTPLAFLVNRNGFAHPVSVADPEIQHAKTVENNSRRPASYTFTVRLQQDRVRL